jgi:hypothetical protein
MNTIIEVTTGQQVTYEKFTPSRAERILNKYNNENRSLREGRAEAMSADMKAGRWTFCVAPIVFYENTEELSDGQHRLWAVIDANIAQSFIVVRGLPKPAALNIDTGLSRDVIDNAKFAGMDLHLSVELLSMSRAVHYGDASRNKSRPMTNAEKIELASKYESVCRWVMSNAPNGIGLRSSAVTGAIARAYMWEKEKERLAEFSKVLTTGFGNGDADTAAITLRNKLKEMRGVPAGQWRDMFLKTQNCIHYFCRRRKLTILKTVKDEQYPLRKGG